MIAQETEKLSGLDLADLEQCIEQTTRGYFLRIGAALHYINERRLYKETHNTFEKYVLERWDMSADTAYQYLSAFCIWEDLSTIVDKMPYLESHFRELKKVAPEYRADVVNAVFARTDRPKASDYRQERIRLEASLELLEKLDEPAKEVCEPDAIPIKPPESSQEPTEAPEQQCDPYSDPVEYCDVEEEDSEIEDVEPGSGNFLQEFKDLWARADEVGRAMISLHALELPEFKERIPDPAPLPTPEKSTRFKPPTEEEVIEYCRDQGHSIDVEHFLAYYGSQNWKKANGQKVTNWKLCITTWVRQRGPQKGVATPVSQLPVRGARR